MKMSNENQLNDYIENRNQDMFQLFVITMCEHDVMFLCTNI